MQYFVKVSFFHARSNFNISRKTNEMYHKVPFVKLHGECDKLLAQSKVPYTILSASHYMSNPLVAHYVSIEAIVGWYIKMHVSNDSS